MEVEQIQPVASTQQQPPQPQPNLQSEAVGTTTSNEERPAAAAAAAAAMAAQSAPVVDFQASATTATTATASSSSSSSSSTTGPPASATVASSTAPRGPPRKRGSVIHMGQGVFRRAGNEQQLLTKWFDCETLHDSFLRGYHFFPNNPCLGKRKSAATTSADQPYLWLSYREVHAALTHFSSGLRHLGVNPGDRVGIYSKNRVEWQIAAEGCNSQSFVTVALYDTLGPESSVYIVNHAELSTIIVEPESMPKLLSIWPQFKTVKFIVQMEQITDDTRQRAASINMPLHAFSEVTQLGEKNPVPSTPSSANSLAVIMYTSGTTGMPKGVQLTNKNVLSTMAGVFGAFSGFGFSDKDVFASYLPLAHILQRACESAFFSLGGSIGYWRGDPRLLMDDLINLRPTLLVAVPRVLEKIRAGLDQVVADSNPVSKWLFHKAYSYKDSNISAGKSSRIWDTLVFRRIQKKVGGRVRGILCGGAYLRPSTQHYMRVIFGCPVIQGYGLTETAAGGTISEFTDNADGHIGAPVGCSEIKLVDAPDMGYRHDANPPSGELCIRGPNVFSGYYKDPEKTREAIDSEGWFHTGDIVQLVDNRFMVIDRIKNLIKLPQGEYVALEKVENMLMACRTVDQICVHADVQREWLVCVIIPNKRAITDFANEKGIPQQADYSQFLKQDNLRHAVLADLQTTGRQQKLLGFEIPMNVWLDNEPFTPDNNMLTPSLKMLRQNFRNKYANQITHMYEELEKKPPAASSAPKQ